MANQERYLKPEVIHQVARLDLRAKFIVEGFLAGLHASPYHGFSVEFSEHRKYVPGDDLKDLDWNVYAKTEKYYVKKFQADCCLKVDGIVGSQTWNYLDAIVPYSQKQHSTLSASSSNNPSEVKYLQARLNQAKRQGKSGTTTIAVDGNFGNTTTTRVKQFQSNFGLSADGIVGNKTWSVLEDALLKS